MNMALDVTARLLNPDRDPLRGEEVELQTYHRQRGWMRLATGQTTNDGSLSLRARLLLGDDGFVPGLRLVGGGRTGAEGARVLGQCASFQTLRATIFVGFGDLALLPDQGVPYPSDPDRESPDRMVAVPVALLNVSAPPPTPFRPGGPTPPPFRDEEVSGVRSIEALKEMLTVESAQAEVLRDQLERREAIIAELKQEQIELRQQRDQFQQALETLRKSEEHSPTVGRLAGAISGALDEARTLGGLDLSNAEIRLRGIVSEAGSRFHPLDAAEAREIRPENVSELTLRLNTPRPQEAPEASVPDVVGKTVETARRHALAEGLGLEVIEEVAPGRPAGAIIAQVPEAGSKVGQARGRLSVVVAVPPSPDEDAS